MAEGLDGVHVITEGLRGRTTAYARPSASAEMSGVVALPMLLHSHAPLDLVVIMLGTNDVHEGMASHQIRDGLARLVEIIRHHPWRLPEACHPKVMLVSPPPVTQGDDPDITEEKVIQSESLADIIKALAMANECAFFDAAGVCRASPVDGFHLEGLDSRALGVALRAEVLALL